MALTSGTKLGPYEIQSPLGAGGMGEVYRARDTRLDRTVAIKVLPGQFTSDPVRKQRFEREAKTISSLNHPHICVLYDVGHQEGMDYLVMECVEGETLAKRLEKGPLPLEQVLKYGMQTADALDKAHRSGVVHRDLKPGNIMLTPTGVKLLDFGLAKLAVPPATGATLTAAATPQAPATEQGTIVGTFQYMSPEQVEGKELDSRSDIFSLGAVLYEMLAGKRAFEGNSQLSVASAILEKEPAPLSSAKPMTPPALDRCIRRCLAKEPERRWQNAADLAMDLQWIAESGSQAGEPERVPAGRGRWEHAGWVLAAAFLLCLLAGAAALLLLPRAATPSRVTRFAISLPAGQTLGGSWWWYRSIALSADGSQIGYVATRDGVSQIYLRAMNDMAARPLPGTEGAHTPFFSPDGQWLGFVVNEKLEKIPVAGGPPVTIVSLSGQLGAVYGACWSPGDTIYFGTDPPRGLMKISAVGGTPQPATKLDAGRQETDHRYPEILPDGKTLLFTVRNATQPSFDEAEIAAASLATGERRILIKGGTDPHYLSSGHLVFLRAGNLLAVPFDPVRLEVNGAPTPVVENVVENPRIGGGQFSVSANGSLVYIPGGVSFGEHELVFVDKTGASRVLTATKRPYEDFTVSPDGRFIATTIEGHVTDTWIHDIARDTETRFTYGVEHRDPAWSPDGKRVAYSGYKDGKYALLWKPVDGSSGEELLTVSGNPIYPAFWSPDGKTLLLMEINPVKGFEVLVLAREGDRKPRPLLESPFQIGWANWSPDGRWIAYDSNESGRSEVYVASFPNLGTRMRISTDGGLHPQWAPNGKELYYRTGASVESLSGRAFAQRIRMMAVDMETTPSLKAGKPRMLFEGPYFASGHDYAVTPDGKGFILIRENESQSGPNEMRVVLNWMAELKKK